MDPPSTVISWSISKHTFLLKVSFFGPNLKLRFDQPSIWHSVLAIVSNRGPLDFITFRGHVSGQDSVPFHYRAIDDHSNPASSKYIEFTFPRAIDGDWWKGLQAEFDQGSIFLFQPEDRNAKRRKLELRAFWEGNKEGTGALPYSPLHACDMRLRDKSSDDITHKPAVELAASLSRDLSQGRTHPQKFPPQPRRSANTLPLLQHHWRSKSAQHSFNRSSAIHGRMPNLSRGVPTPTVLPTIEETPEPSESDLLHSDLAAEMIKPKHDMSAGPLEVALRGWQGQIEEVQKALATLPRARKNDYETLRVRALRGIAADQSLISTTLWRLRENVENQMAERAKEAPPDRKEADKETQQTPSGGDATPQAGSRDEQEQAQNMMFELGEQGNQGNPHQSVQAHPTTTNTDRAKVREEDNANSSRYENAQTEEERRIALRALFNVPPHLYREYLLSKGRKR